MKSICLVLVFALTVALVGCGKKEEPTPSTSVDDTQKAPPTSEIQQPSTENMTSHAVPSRDFITDHSQQLTEPELACFITIFPQVVNLAKEAGERLTSTQVALNDGEALRTWVKEYSVSKDIQSLLDGYGLEPQDFASIADRTIRSYSVVKAREAMQKVESDVGRALAEMKQRLDDPDISPSEKNQVQTAMSNMKRMQKDLVVGGKDDINFELIRTHMAQLDAMLENLR